MRWTLAFVPLLMLTGCLTSPADEAAASDDADLPDGVRSGVVFYDETYHVLPNEPLEFMVHVPQGARAVRLEMSASGTASPLDEAIVTLSGCGQGHVSWSPGSNVVISVSVLGGSWRRAELCDEAQGGSKMITVDTGLTPMMGRLILRADLPASPAP